MKPRNITQLPSALRFGPLDVKENGDPIIMTTDELEALRLVDHEGLMQEEAALCMGVSRGTVWRCLTRARSKMALMLVEARAMVITDMADRGEAFEVGSGSIGMEDE
jgi:predicted DNA-binding protein (UPF0251 family)